MSCLRMELAFSISSVSAKASRSAGDLSFSSCRLMRVRPIAAMVLATSEGFVGASVGRLAASVLAIGLRLGFGGAVVVGHGDVSLALIHSMRPRAGRTPGAALSDVGAGRAESSRWEPAVCASARGPE